MTSRELELFHAVMSSRSLTEAAATLGVSQPALSKSLKRLEDRLRVPLFRRVKGRLRPTLEAESLFPEAARLIREIHRLSRSAMEMRGGEVGLLRLGASASLGLSVVPSAVASFGADFPKVKIVSHFLGAAGIAELIVDNRLDVGITLSPTEVPGTISQSLATVPIVCVLPLGHALAQKPVIRPRDLQNERLISFGADSYFGRLLDDAFLQEGLERQIAIELIMGVQAMPLVSRGAGVALVDGYMPHAGFPGVVCRPFQPRVLLPVNVVTATARLTSRLASGFIAHLTKAVAQTPARPPDDPAHQGTGTSSRARA